MDSNLLDRITLNPLIGHGKPTVRNTRYLVESILEYLSAGDSSEDILESFPDLERDGIKACIAFATEVLKNKGISYSMAQ
jgi:uncharacterized protein (DUF433 family)